MLQTHHNRGPWRWACCASALLVLLIAAIAPTDVTAQAQRSVVARGREALPADELMFKLNEVSIRRASPA